MNAQTHVVQANVTDDIAVNLIENAEEKKQFNNSVKAVKNLTALAKKLTSK